MMDRGYIFLKNGLYEGVLGNIISMKDHLEEVGNCFLKKLLM